jgi:UDP-GlcNAc:undecaprenyl-phosphate GlcNAc-1-phosphate transferase
MHLRFASLFFLSFLASMCLTPVVIALTRRLDCIDYPKAEQHKTHAHPIPLAGGILIFFMLLGLIIIKPAILSNSLVFVLAGGLIAGISGFLDDIYGLRARWKLLGQFLALSVLLLGQVHAQVFQYAPLNYAITALWIIGITNAFNLIDGLDGLATGLAAIALAFLAFITIGSGQLDITIITTVLLATIVWLYYLNVVPARLFLGDSGSQMLGFLIAALLLTYTPPGFSLKTSWFLPVMLMGVVIFDTTLVVISRLFNHQPIYLGNRDHIHHRLIYTGMAPNRAALTIHLISVAVSVLGFLALESSTITANLIFASTCFIGLGTIVYLNRKQIRERLSL